MAQAQTIEPTNFDEINFQITSKENPDAYIESRFVPGNSAYARSSEEDGKTLVGYVDATVYVEETYTKGEDGNIFTTDSIRVFGLQGGEVYKGGGLFFPSR